MCVIVLVLLYMVEDVWFYFFFFFYLDNGFLVEIVFEVVWFKVDVRWFLVFEEDFLFWSVLF